MTASAHCTALPPLAACYCMPEIAAGAGPAVTNEAPARRAVGGRAQLMAAGHAGHAGQTIVASTVDVSCIRLG